MWRGTPRLLHAEVTNAMYSSFERRHMFPLPTSNILGSSKIRIINLSKALQFSRISWNHIPSQFMEFHRMYPMELHELRQELFVYPAVICSFRVHQHDSCDPLNTARDFPIQMIVQTTPDVDWTLHQCLRIIGAAAPAVKQRWAIFDIDLDRKRCPPGIFMDCCHCPNSNNSVNSPLGVRNTDSVEEDYH